MKRYLDLLANVAIIVVLLALTVVSFLVTMTEPLI